MAPLSYPLNRLIPVLVLLLFSSSNKLPQSVSAELSSYDSRFHASLDSYEDFARERDERYGGGAVQETADEALAAPVSIETPRKLQAYPSGPYDGQEGYVTVHRGNTINFALAFGASGDISNNQTLAVDSTNLTMCYRFASEHFQSYTTTKLDLRFISQVDSSTGPSDVAVVDVPEHFIFRGYGITPFQDQAYWVRKDDPCTIDPLERANIKESTDGIVTVGRDGNTTFTFTTVNSGHDLQLCYKFQTERAARVYNHTTIVTQVHELQQSQGDVGVSVVDYPKNYIFSGEYLSLADKFKWGIDGDCNAAPAEIWQNDFDNNTLNLVDTKDYLTHPSPYNTSLNATFTMRGSATGLNLTMCYKHRAEPWTSYAFWTNDVRMVHNVSSLVGDWNRSVAEQPKVLKFHGHGLENGDQAKFVTANATGYVDCNDYTHNVVLLNPDNVANQHRDIVSDNLLDHEATFNFDPASAGQWVHLCYKFNNEPYQIYPNIMNQIHFVSNLTSFVGDIEYTVVDVPERIAVHGKYVTELDKGRWVHHSAASDADCLDTGLILYSDGLLGGAGGAVVPDPSNRQVNIEESIYHNTTVVPNPQWANDKSAEGRQITFAFNESYRGQIPKYCHKFKNEPYKIYENFRTKIAHVFSVEGLVGTNDVAVVDYEKGWKFHGGHISNKDHVKWSLVGSDSCESPIVSQSFGGAHGGEDLEDGTGNTTRGVDNTNSVYFNFTSANSGNRVRLCYQFGNEPYKAYSKHEVHIRMIHNFSTPAYYGDFNRSVVAYPKPLTFFGHGLNTRGRLGGTGDRAKWLITATHFSDCNVAGKTAQLMDNSIEEMAVDVDTNNATFWFDVQAAGYWVALCYAFEHEPYQIYYQHRNQVNMLKTLTAAQGDTNVAVVDYPKVMSFSGEFLAEGDKFRWVSPFPDGHAACEGHGFDQAQCAAVGCCVFDSVASACASNVGSKACPAAGRLTDHEACTSIDQSSSIYDSATALHSSVTEPPQNTTVLLAAAAHSVTSGYVTPTTTVGTFTMTPKSSGRNNTLCYKHRNQPWKLYEHFTHDVRQIHGITVGTGDINVTVVDQDKVHFYHGDGNFAGDRVKYVKRLDLNDPSNVNYFKGNRGFTDGVKRRNLVDYADCNNITRTARINDQDSMSEWSKTVEEKYLSVGGVNSSETRTILNFHESSGGYVVMLCYAFENEPYQLYTEFVSQVHMLRNISSFQGGRDVIVAHVGERLGFHGDYITNQDQGRWVLGNGTNETEGYEYSYSGARQVSGFTVDSMCNDDVGVVLKSYAKKIWSEIVFNNVTNETESVVKFNYTFFTEEDITTNHSNPGNIYDIKGLNTSHEATFWYNESYSGATPTYCHKFKNEPWKIYPEQTIKIAHIEDVTVNTGDVDVAVVEYQKKWTFHGGHLLSNPLGLDRVKWVLSNTPGCDDSGGLYNLDSDGVTGENISTTVVSNSATWNATTAAKGLTYKLCYQFSNEPYRPYVEFPLNVREVTGRSVNDGNVDKAVPFLEKYYFFSGEELGGYDRVKWVKFDLDCNVDAGEPLYGGSSKLMAQVGTSANGDILSSATHPSMDGSYTPATFVDRLSGGPLKTCYKFENEPYKTYWGLTLTVVGLSEITSVGSPDVLVLDYQKEFTFMGQGVDDGDIAFWVFSDARTDLDCQASSPYLTGYAGTINSDGATNFLITDRQYAGHTFLLCYKFGKESPKLYPEFTLSLKTMGGFVATIGTNTTSVVGTSKTYKLVGGQTAEGDRAKWVEGVIEDAGCADVIAGGTTNASTVTGDLVLGFDFSSPSPLNSYFTLCYAFGSEPFKLYPNLVTQVVQMSGLNETYVIVNSPQTMGIFGTGGTDADSVKFVSSHQSCNDNSAFAAGSTEYKVFNSAFVATFSSAEEDMVLCYKFGQEPYSRFDEYKVTSLDPKVSVMSVSSAVVGQQKLVKLTGTFGVTEYDSIKFVPNTASDCMVDTDGEGPGNDARATSVYEPLNMTRSLGDSMGGGQAMFFLSTSDGVDDGSPLLLCYRFGPPGTNYTFFPSLTLASNEINYIYVNMDELSVINSVVEFTFSGTGLKDYDKAKFIDPAGTSDYDCLGLSNVGGSSEAEVVNGKATFQFKEGFSKLVLCYKFGSGEPYKIYTGLEVINTAVANEEEQEPVFLEAPAEVVLSLAGSIDEIPPGSPAETQFKTNFVSDISSALGIDTSRVTITSITSGSIIVQFEIAVSQNSAEPLVSELVEELTEQINDPASVINSGNTTSRVQAPPAVVYLEPVEVLSASDSATSSAVRIVSYQRSGLFQFASDVYYTTEGSGTAYLEVERSHGDFGEVVLEYGTIAGTATAGLDFEQSYGKLTFFGGERSKNIEIKVLDDAVREPHFETFEVWMRIDDGATKGYQMNGYEAVTGTKRNATVRVYDWGEGGQVVGSSSFTVENNIGVGEASDMNGWTVLGNDAEDLFMSESESYWVDTWGLASSDIRYGKDEYNDKCDFAAPKRPCGYSCQYGDHALADVITGEPSTVLQLDGNGYVVSYVPFTDSFTDKLTIGLWVRASSLASAPTGTIWSYAVGGDENTEGGGFHEVLLSNHRDLSLLIRDRVVGAGERYDGSEGGDRRGIKLGINLADDYWHFVVVSWRSSDGRVVSFLDGAEVFNGGPYRVGELVRTGGSGMLGMSQDGPCSFTADGALNACALEKNTGFIGQMQNLHLMRAFVGQEDAGQMMQIPSQASMDSLAALWKFGVSTSSGRVIDDSSGKGNHLYEGGNKGYASQTGATLVVGTPKSLMPMYPCGEIYSNIWHFAGGAAFKGDLSGAYGGRLQFKLMASSFSGNVRSKRGSVVLIGGDGTAISYRRVFGAPHENGGLGVFNYYSVILREDHGWYSEPGGELLARDQFESVLKDVSKLLIRGDEFVYGGEGYGSEIVTLNDVTLYQKR
ncbi:hypothetical protein TrVE_jg62 [Triparma verrucosa]|uniref:Laminin IV type A domain-containing protein n=1 Tax=Triparma verrucosa TaxID=1606542 RepID=A0A9W7KV82_9STRA|nr:hypothetical protein TrVE_jg62 [Triparma verrucosa]